MFELIFNNKKGGEKLLSIWWFFVLVIIGVAVAISVSMYYSAEVDVRQMESEILYEKIVECVVEQGFLINELLDTQQEVDILDKCELSKDIFRGGSDFYFRINVLDVQGNKIRPDIKEGDLSLEQDCYIEKQTKAEYYPKCFEKNETALYSQNNEIKKATLNILTGSNQIGNKISVIER